MKLNFSIEYNTNWGESIVLCLDGKRVQLEYVADGLWQGEVTHTSLKESLEYKYEVVRDGVTVRKEWGKHILPKGLSAKVVNVNDRWQDRPADAPFYSSAFTKGIFGRGAAAGKKVDSKGILMVVNAPVVRPDEVLAIAGSGKALENWSKVVPFDDSEFPVWTLSLEAGEPFMYKLVIADRQTLEPKAWEDGENRVMAVMPTKDSCYLEAALEPRFYGRQWRGAGTAIPVFSLRSEDDFGVGEFLDLKKMVDWAAETGQSILQLLPINDTTMTGTWEDSYPYNANSTFALHPQFINLPAAGVPVTKAYKEMQAELNSLAQIDYEKVNNTKLELLRKAYQKTFAKLSATKSYKAFMASNEEWLMPYAAFCVLRDMNGTPDFSKWKTNKKYNAKKIAAFCEENREAVDFWCFVQYHLDAQLSEVCRYAHSKGVVLKGDLPIGISRTSVDAWLYPELFHMDSQAGAPPDAFAEDGQNWGFPTYNWEKMAEDDYAWWKARLSKMSEYFDAFRIDHILGFFRIWQIPLWSKSGLDGYFSPALPYAAEELTAQGFDVEDKELFIEDPHKPGYYHPKIGAKKTRSYSILDAYRRSSFDKLYTDFFYYRHNQFWKETAMKKLPALLDSTGMLACGEDLGMIPATVPQVMSDLRILSLEIQRMPKSVEETFAHPANYPYLSVCTTSTHDMNPVRAWWEEDREVTQQFWNMLMGNQGEAPYYCEPWICRQILEQHLWSPAMLTVLPLQDWLSMDGALRRENPNDERINVPANPRHYWRYRMHMTIEELASQKEFNDTLTAMIADSGRK